MGSGMNSLKSVFTFETEDLPQTVKKDDKNKDSLTKSGRHGQTAERPSLQKTLIFTLLFMVLNVNLRVNSASYLRKTRLHVFFVWLQSLMISVAFLWISRKRRRGRYLKVFPVLCCYIVYVAVNESYSNTFKNTSGGPEVLQLGLATSPLFIILSQTWFYKKVDASLVTIFVMFVSLIIIFTFCSENDPYIPYKFTFSYGIFGLIHGLMLAVFILISKKYLTVEEISIVKVPWYLKEILSVENLNLHRGVFLATLFGLWEMSISELIYSVNLGCVLCLPVVILLNGEIDIIIANGFSSFDGFYNLLYAAFILALLRMFDQITGFYHIKGYSSLLHVTARNFAWIPATLIITFSFRMELLISSFFCFWLVGVTFLAVLVEEITDVNS